MARKYGYSLLVETDENGADMASWKLVRMSDNHIVGAAYVDENWYAWNSTINA